MCSVPLGEIEITEEERSSIMEGSEIEGHRPHEETREEREQAQKERKVKDNGLAPKQRTQTDEERLEEAQR